MVFFLTVSERKNFHIGESGLISDPRYFVSMDFGGIKGLIFNNFSHSLDSMFFSETQWSYGVGNVFSLSTTPEQIVFMNPEQVFNQNRETGEVSMKFMHEYGVFGGTKYLGVSVPTPSSTHEFYGLNEENGVGYFVFGNDSEARIAGYKPALGSMLFLPGFGF